MTDAEIAAAGAVPTGKPEPSRRPRLFGFLDQRVPGDVTATGAPSATHEPVAVGVPPPELDQNSADVTLLEGPSMTDAEIAAAGKLAPETPEPSRRPRLFGFLNKRIPGDVANGPDDSAMVLAAAPPAVGAPISDAVPTDELPQSDTLIAGNRTNVPDRMADAGPELLLPFGEVVRVCGLKKRELGLEVSRHNGFSLYDTDPSSTLPRNQFLVGFKDGCARQFTGALTLFGSPSVHEATRYAKSNTSPYSQTDVAYEKIKNRVCGVRRGQFCPEKRAAKLEKSASFVTVYPGFGSTSEWLEVLLHKGQLVTYQTRRR